MKLGGGVSEAGLAAAELNLDAHLEELPVLWTALLVNPLARNRPHPNPGPLPMKEVWSVERKGVEVGGSKVFSWIKVNKGGIG
jgi:hypothetical protein